MSTMLTKAQYAEQIGASKRTVERWIEVGVLAVDVVDGTTMVPAGTPRPSKEALAAATSRDVAVVAPTTAEVAPVAAPAFAPLGLLVPLEDYARVLGTSVGGVRRLGRDGRLDVGRYGPRGALRVWVSPRG